MDAMPLDIWIEAQTPPVYEEIVEFRATGNSFGKSDEELTGDLRGDALYETAYSLAAQTALAWRYEQLLKLTKSQEGTLDRIANFSPFVVDQHMLLPSITEVRDRFELSQDDSKLRTVEIQYRVDEPPKAISTPPTWRDYLWREYSYPEDPHPKLLPRTDAEVAAWEQAIKEGWKSGLEQAHFSWTNNLNEMVQDIRGRITYRILETRGIVESPVMVGSVPEMTTSENGKTINAGDTVYSVTVPMTFNSQNQWEALWVSMDKATAPPQFESDAGVSLSAPGSDDSGNSNNMPKFGGE